MPLRILLADENLAVQKLVEMTLSQENMDVTITDNGLSALDIAIKQHPDLILVDYKMEGLDISSFVKKAKKREDIAGIPIILLVDSSETHDPIDLQSLGVEAFLKKPIDTEELKEKIKALSLLSEPIPEEISEAPGKSDLSQHFTSSDDDSKMIADLLGWSTPENNPQAESSEAALPTPEEEKVLSDPDIQTEQPEQIQVDPIIQESDPAPFEGQEEDSESPEATGETTEEQAPDSNPFPFETGGLFSNEEQGHTKEEFHPTLEEAEQDAEENDLLQPPAYGESIIVPQQGDDIKTTPQETETESRPFAFEENDPFAQTEQVDSGEEDLLKAAPLDGPFDDSPGLSEQSDPLVTSEEETKVEEAKEEEIVAPPLPTRFEEPPSAQEQSQDQSNEAADPALSDELIRKTMQETAERIVKEMLPGLVKSSLSQEMLSPIVEGVAWELIPPLAEAEIKKEIKRLQPEKDDS